MFFKDLLISFLCSFTYYLKSSRKFECVIGIANKTALFYNTITVLSIIISNLTRLPFIWLHRVGSFPVSFVFSLPQLEELHNKS